MINVYRKINLIGDIDHEAYLKFTRKLTRLEDESGDPIHIVLCSDGGDASVALAFHDRIKMSSCEISVTGIGMIASAAVLILVACEKRSLTRNSWVMVHDDTVVDVDNRRVVEADKMIRHAVRVENQWNKLMADATGTNADVWDKLHKNETYFSASECLELGIIQEII